MERLRLSHVGSGQRWGVRDAARGGAARITKVIAERLGHASTNMTVNRHMHVSPGMQERATKRISEALYSGSQG